MKKKVVILCFLLIISALLISNLHSVRADEYIGDNTGLSCGADVEQGGVTTKTCTLKIEVLKHVYLILLPN